MSILYHTQGRQEGEAEGQLTRAPILLEAPKFEKILKCSKAPSVRYLEPKGVHRIGLEVPNPIIGKF